MLVVVLYYVDSIVLDYYIGFYDKVCVDLFVVDFFLSGSDKK